ncbi:hypothetical protein [Nonlabens antarcticus]|uniref:hypothetical protein n=1 Tax=Nonlabens antarcticus TaxID=392714 RepID=UPI001891A4E0|nr:hypothetical protein [Nonlabens antarcticus]
MKSILLLSFVLLSAITTAQVGIRTAEPKSDLEIVSNPNPGIDNYNGIIIPKVIALPMSGDDAFPKSEQAGLLLYLDSSNPIERGIYVFDGTQYIQLDAAVASGAFYDNGTTDFATTTTGDIQRSGNISVGSSLRSGRFNIEILNSEPATGLPRIGMKIINANKSRANVASYSIFTENETASSNNKVGIRTDVSAAGSGDHIGIENNVKDNGVASSGSVIGIFNNVGNVIGTATGIENYGIKSVIGTASSSGPIYGVYSEANGTTVDKVYAGLFNGVLGVGDVARTMGYDFPLNRGDADQVLTSNGTGKSSWKTFNDVSSVKSIRTISSGTALTTDHTLLITGNIDIPKASSSNLGQIYVIALGMNADNIVVTSLGDDFVVPGASTPTSVFTLSTGSTGARSRTIQSDGLHWFIINVLKN